MGTRLYGSKDLKSRPSPKKVGATAVDVKTTERLFSQSSEIARNLGKLAYKEVVEREVPSLLPDGTEKRMKVDSYTYDYNAGSLQILLDGINIITEISKGKQGSIHPDEHGTVTVKHGGKTVFEATTFGTRAPEITEYNSKSTEWTVLMGDIYERLMKSLSARSSL